MEEKREPYWDVFLTQEQRDALWALLMDIEEDWAMDLLSQLPDKPHGHFLD